MDENQHIEALLLDYIEGRLDEADREKVEAYLAAHPEVGDALDGMETTVLQPQKESFENRNTLKLPAGNSPEEVEAREMLYSLSMDDELSTEEQRTFDALTAREEFRKEYGTWRQTTLTPSDDSFDKVELYRTGEALPLSDTTYEDHLIARAEGLLNAEQNRALEAFAQSKPHGGRDLRSADALRLSPALGVFYPDKSKLYRTERKPMIWWYRLSAVAAILILFWLSYPLLERNQPMENVPLTAMKSLPAQVDASKPAEALPNTLNFHSAIEAEPSNRSGVNETALAQGIEKQGSDRDESDRDAVGREALSTERLKPISEVAVVSPTGNEIREIATLPAAGKPEPSEDPSLLAFSSQAPASESSDRFLTLPEWAISKTLGGSTAESAEASVLALAEDLKRKAGKVLDAEVSRETAHTSSGERQTFSLRIGGFAVERSSSK